MRTKLFREKNPMWKGSKVSYGALHDYIKFHFPKPQFCEECKKEKPFDLANKGIYNRDFENWEWLCRKCHMKKDGRDKLLSNRNKGKPRSEETKSKISKTHKIKGIKPPSQKGKPKSEEQKRKMSATHKKWWKDKKRGK